MEGYDSLRGAAAWFDVSSRGRIWVQGDDRARLLHAMCTNHVEQLEPGQGCYAFFLNAQGRILTDVEMYCLEDRFLLSTEAERGEFLLKHLDGYIIADDVTLEDATGSLAEIAVEGPQAAAVLSGLGLPVPEMAFAHAESGGVRVARASVTGGAGYRVFVAAAEREALLARLAIPHAAPEAVDAVRLENAKPRYGVDFSETTLPQETRIAEALHFSKGCYLGQEIVERIRSRGHLNRYLMPVRLQGADAPARGFKLMREGKEAGEITSAAYSPALGAVVGLAMLRAQHAATGTTVDGGEVV